MKKARYILIAAIIFIDQLVKCIVRKEMFVGESIPVIDGIFHFTYVKNTGAAFNLFEGASTFLFVVPMLAVVLAAWFMEKNLNEHCSLTLALIFIIAGGVGNIIDRVHSGFVTDMIDFRFFPVFNVADIAICIGAFLLILYILRFESNERNAKDRK